MPKESQDHWVVQVRMGVQGLQGQLEQEALQELWDQLAQRVLAGIQERQVSRDLLEFLGRGAHLGKMEK